MGTRERKREHRIKEDVINRDGLLCCYCEQVLTYENCTLEHIIPYSHNGMFNSTNLTIACFKHNNQRGNKPFFDYCKKFNWSEDKINKYKVICKNNLKIKILNIAKETCLSKYKNGQAVPNILINKACKILKIKKISFNDYEKLYTFDINFNEICSRNRIKFCFELLIRIIEADSW